MTPIVAKYPRGYSAGIEPELVLQITNKQDNYISQIFFVKKVKNYHVLNGRMDFTVTIIELVCFLNRT